MTHRLFFSPLIWGLAVGIALCAQPRESRADLVPVDAGYDLFTTVPGGPSSPSGGTFFNFGAGIGVQDLMGVPLGTYNFDTISSGGSNNGYMAGVQNVGNTDTIVERLSPVTVSGGTTPLQLVALQLETVSAVTIAGLGTGNLFVTLTPGAPETGSMTINSNDTFTSTLNITFDVHFGSLTGTTIATGLTDTLNGSGFWSHTAPPGSVLIPGVNYLLNGMPLPSNPSVWSDGDPTTDFWPAGGPIVPGQPWIPLTEPEAGGQHSVDPTIVPEPNTAMVSALAAVIGLAYAGWNRRRRGAAEPKID